MPVQPVERAVSGCHSVRGQFDLISISFTLLWPKLAAVLALPCRDSLLCMWAVK